MIPHSVGSQSNNRFGKRTKWGLLLASTVLAILCAEGTLRIVWHNPYRTEAADRVVKLRLQHADTHHQFDRSAIHPEQPITLLRTDSRSYIFPSFQYEDPDSTIAFLGGSTTECCAVEEGTRFPALVSTKMSEIGVRVNTLNAGTSGNTLHDSINNLFNHVLQDSPDIVVLMHACNDIGVLHEDGDYASRSGQFVSWSTVARASLMKLTNYSYLLARSRQTLKEHTHYAPTAPEDLARQEMDGPSEHRDGAYESRLRMFIRACHAFDIQPVVMTQPMTSHFTSLTPEWADQSVQSRFNNIVRRVGSEEGAIVIDLVNYLKEDVVDWDTHLHIFYDGVHITDEGSRVYGGHIVECLLPLVRDRARSVSPGNQSERELGGLHKVRRGVKRRQEARPPDKA